MKITFLDNRFKKLRHMMGISEVHVPTWENLKQWESINPGDWDLLNSGGKEVNLADVRTAADGTLEWRGHKVVLHIFTVRQHWNANEQNLPKFHVAECETLIKMRQKGAYERYVVSQRTTGTFEVSLSPGKSEKRRLNVCKTCLRKLQYKGYENAYQKQKDKIVSEFSIVEFYKVYDKGFYNVPSFTDQNAKSDNYTEDWHKISVEIRCIRNWTCEECNRNLIGDKKFLHVHHRNFIRSDNSPSNLHVLCIGCHSRQDNHSHLRNSRDFAPYMAKYPPGKFP